MLLNWFIASVLALVLLKYIYSIYSCGEDTVLGFMVINSKIFQINRVINKYSEMAFF